MRKISFALFLFSMNAWGAECQTESEAKKDLWESARCYFKEARQEEKAAETLKKLTQAHPSEWSAYPMSAWLYYEASKAEQNQERRRLEKESESMIQEGYKYFSDSWIYLREMGDFYRLRLGSAVKAQIYYEEAVKYADGNEDVGSATKIQKAALLDRLARNSEELGRKGDAVKAACLAIRLDPNDKMAKKRIEDLAGNCQRKLGLKKKEDASAETESDPKPAEEKDR